MILISQINNLSQYLDISLPSKEVGKHSPFQRDKDSTDRSVAQLKGP